MKLKLAWGSTGHASVQLSWKWNPGDPTQQTLPIWRVFSFNRSSKYKSPLTKHTGWVFAVHIIGSLLAVKKQGRRYFTTLTVCGGLSWPWLHWLSSSVGHFTHLVRGLDHQHQLKAKNSTPLWPYVSPARGIIFHDVFPYCYGLHDRGWRAKGAWVIYSYNFPAIF